MVGEIQRDHIEDNGMQRFAMYNVYFPAMRGMYMMAPWEIKTVSKNEIKRA